MINATMADSEKTVDPGVTPLSFISGIVRSSEEFEGLNITIGNNTQVGGKVIVDYLLANRTSLTYFKADTLLLSNRCSKSVCLAVVPHVNTRTGEDTALLDRYPLATRDTGNRTFTSRVRFTRFFDAIPKVSD